MKKHMQIKENASHNFDTLTVELLINILKQYPMDTKVFTTWESTIHAIYEENIYETVTGCLYIDADNNSYMEEFTIEKVEN